MPRVAAVAVATDLDAVLDAAKRVHLEVVDGGLCEVARPGRRRDLPVVRRVVSVVHQPGSENVDTITPSKTLVEVSLAAR